jgi:hypothetical protein
LHIYCSRSSELAGSCSMMHLCCVCSCASCEAQCILLCMAGIIPTQGPPCALQCAELQNELARWQEKHNTATTACAAAQEALSDMQKQNKSLQTELDLKALLLGNANSGKQELQVRCWPARSRLCVRPKVAAEPVLLEHAQII